MTGSKANPDDQRGFTLAELLAVIVLIGCVAAGVTFFGWLGGTLLGVIAFLLAGSVLALVRDGLAGIPRLPRCWTGCCRGPGLFFGHGDYHQEKVGDEDVRVCRCGIRHKRSGRRFLVVSVNGTETPYLVWKPFRGWFPDHDAGGLATSAGGVASCVEPEKQR